MQRQPWPFAGAMAVVKKTRQRQRRAPCVRPLALFGSWRDGEPVLEAEPGFELDTYKMLAGCLRKLPKGARLEPWDGWPAA